jgi:hypothetical protein
MLEGGGFCHGSVGSVVVEESRMLRCCNHGDAAGTDLVQMQTSLLRHPQPIKVRQG